MVDCTKLPSRQEGYLRGRSPSRRGGGSIEQPPRLALTAFGLSTPPGQEGSLRRFFHSHLVHGKAAGVTFVKWLRFWAAWFAAVLAGAWLFVPPARGAPSQATCPIINGLDVEPPGLSPALAPYHGQGFSLTVNGIGFGFGSGAVVFL